jgi:hypothetical protein
VVAGAGGDCLLAELLENFLAHVEANNAPATFKLRRLFLRSFIRHAGVSLKASALRADHVHRGWLPGRAGARAPGGRAASP